MIYNKEKFQDKLMESKDRRMKATSEILRNKRILKLQAWEMKFLSKIIDLRKTETGWLRKFVYTSAMTTFVFWGAPTFVSGHFCCLHAFGDPTGIREDLICACNIQNSSRAHLQSSRHNFNDSTDKEKLPRGSSDTAIEILDANFSWELSSPNPTLKDINLKVSHGMKVAVCGTVGSGKSSLLFCILGEVPKISGTLKLCGTKAYVSQSPWRHGYSVVR
ncbi:hypothetical protein ABKV19_017182 [Rosa sericea]